MFKRGFPLMESTLRQKLKTLDLATKVSEGNPERAKMLRSELEQLCHQEGLALTPAQLHTVLEQAHDHQEEVGEWAWRRAETPEEWSTCQTLLKSWKAKKEKAHQFFWRLWWGANLTGSLGLVIGLMASNPLPAKLYQTIGVGILLFGLIFSMGAVILGVILSVIFLAPFSSLPKELMPWLALSRENTKQLKPYTPSHQDLKTWLARPACQDAVAWVVRSGVPLTEADRHALDDLADEDLSEANRRLREANWKQIQNLILNSERA